MALFIIAEIGINANGSVELAKKLIDMAKSCGADAVKFQKRTITTVYSADYLDSPRESPWGTTQRDQKRGLEFKRHEYDEIDAYCKKVGMPWFASAWDLASLTFLKRYDLPYNKIASPMLTHSPLLEMVAKQKKDTFISTGMSTYAQISAAVKIFEKHRCPFILMHTTSSYPCCDGECNIGVITELRRRYKCPVGYSGHEVGLLPSILAVALGATAIERHITLDRASYGSDQAASLERAGLERLVRDCRAVEAVIGDGMKRVYESEQKALKSLRYWHDLGDNPGKGR
jgi:N-acetylneuraminate synthase